MSPSILPGDTVQDHQESSLLHHALLQLPEEKREVLVLSRLQELKYEEVAQILGCEVGTVKVRVHRALQELKQVFHQLQGNRPSKVTNISSGSGTPPQGVGNGL